MSGSGLDKAILSWKSTDLPALQRFLDNEVRMQQHTHSHNVGPTSIPLRLATYPRSPPLCAGRHPVRLYGRTDVEGGVGAGAGWWWYGASSVVVSSSSSNHCQHRCHLGCLERHVTAYVRATPS